MRSAQGKGLRVLLAIGLLLLLAVALRQLSKAEQPIIGKAGSNAQVQLTVAAMCADTVDNDGDGRRDYPLDCGCENAQDNTEDTLCSATCGNGVVDTSEQCDDRNRAGGDGCAANCMLENMCGNNAIERPNDYGVIEQCDSYQQDQFTCANLGVLLGSACQSRCTAYCTPQCTASITITGASCGDGVLDACELCDGSRTRSGITCANFGFTGCQITLTSCTASCTPDLTVCAACPPTCGNGLIEGGERCDGAALNGWSCRTFGFSGGTLACTTQCQFSTSACTGNATNTSNATCGNSIINTGEQCDGTNLGGSTCQSLNYRQGTLRCGTNCRFDASQCSGLGVTACSDGQDNDRDGRADYPADCGCSNAQDTSEDTACGTTGGGSGGGGGNTSGGNRSSGRNASGTTASPMPEIKPPVQPDSVQRVQPPPPAPAPPSSGPGGGDIASAKAPALAQPFGFTFNWPSLALLIAAALFTALKLMRTRIVDNSMLLALMAQQQVQQYRKLFVHPNDHKMLGGAYQNVRSLNKPLRLQDRILKEQLLQRYELPEQFTELVLMAKRAPNPTLLTDRLLPQEVHTLLRKINFSNPIARAALPQLRPSPEFQNVRAQFALRALRGMSYPRIAEELAQDGVPKLMIQAAYEEHTHTFAQWLRRLL